MRDSNSRATGLGQPPGFKAGAFSHSANPPSKKHSGARSGVPHPEYGRMACRAFGVERGAHPMFPLTALAGSSLARSTHEAFGGGSRFQPAVFLRRGNCLADQPGFEPGRLSGRRILSRNLVSAAHPLILNRYDQT